MSAGVEAVETATSLAKAGCVSADKTIAPLSQVKKRAAPSQSTRLFPSECLLADRQTLRRVGFGLAIDSSGKYPRSGGPERGKLRRKERGATFRPPKQASGSELPPSLLNCVSRRLATCFDPTAKRIPGRCCLRRRKAAMRVALLTTWQGSLRGGQGVGG